MPEFISVTEFVEETNEDYKAPTTSSFTTRMSHCRSTVADLEEVSTCARTTWACQMIRAEIKQIIK